MSKNTTKMPALWWAIAGVLLAICFIGIAKSGEVAPLFGIMTAIIVAVLSLETIIK